MSASQGLSTTASDLRELTVRVADVDVVVQGLEQDLRERLANLMEPFVTDHLEGHPGVFLDVARLPRHSGRIVVLNGQVQRAFQDANKLLSYLEWAAVAYALDATSAYAVFHAAALTHHEDTILLVADSRSGKTTLTTSLMQREWLPLADDISLVTRSTGEVHIFPRCFHADEFTLSTILTPSLIAYTNALTGYIRPHQWASRSSRPTCVVHVTRDSSLPSAARRLSQAEAAGMLLGASIGQKGKRPDVVRDVVSLISATRTCWQLNNNDLSEAVTLLERIATSEWSPVAPLPN